MNKTAGFRARAPLCLLIAAVLLAAIFSLNAQPIDRKTFAAADRVSDEKEAPMDAREAFISGRASARERERAALRAILESEGTSDDLQKSAEDMLFALSACAEYETLIETALQGMHLTGLSSVGEKSAYVFVDQTLTARQAALLFAAVSEITGRPDDAIRVSDGNAPET